VRGAVAGAAALAACAAGGAAGCGGGRTTAPPIAVPPAPVPPVEVAPPADTTASPTPGSEGDRRFLIVAVGDSTVSLVAPRARWVRPGMYGIAVDPGRRDALVARLYVQSRVADTAVALVTGQTTRMSTDYVAILRRPNTPVLRQRAFWGGVAAGAAAAAAAALAAMRLF
jgi:hypothetical protein